MTDIPTPTEEDLTNVKFWYHDYAMAAEKVTYEGRIVQNPEILVGKPVVKGTRIPVELILGHLAQNPDLADLFAAYPHLTLEDVQACLAYAQAAVKAKGRRAVRKAARGAPTPPDALRGSA